MSSRATVKGDYDIHPDLLDRIHRAFHTGSGLLPFTVVERLDNEWDIINRFGDIYESIQLVCQNRVIVSKDGKSGVIDRHNNIILPIEYNSLYFLFDNLYKTKNNEGKWGVINEQGNLVLKYEYDLILENRALKLLAVTPLVTSIPRNRHKFRQFYFDKDGLIDKDGEIHTIDFADDLFFRQ